jgi:hypothetical protein
MYSFCEWYMAAGISTGFSSFDRITGGEDRDSCEDAATDVWAYGESYGGEFV